MDYTNFKCRGKLANASTNLKYKFVYPKRNLELDVLKSVMQSNSKKLFDSKFFYNFIVLTDSELSTIAYYKNQALMLSRMILCEGLSFREKFMSKTSLSEAYRSKSTSIVYAGESSNPEFNSFTNCAVPIKNGNEVAAFVSAFFLSSKHDEDTIEYFKLFAMHLEFYFNVCLVKKKTKEYISEHITPTFSMKYISKSEKKVLALLKKGYSNKEIADKLFISENTVKSHVKYINEKLSCNNRTQTVVNALLHELSDIINSYGANKK